MEVHVLIRICQWKIESKRDCTSQSKPEEMKLTENV